MRRRKPQRKERRKTERKRRKEPQRNAWKANKRRPRKNRRRSGGAAERGGRAAEGRTRHAAARRQSAAVETPQAPPSRLQWAGRLAPSSPRRRTAEPGTRVPRKQGRGRGNRGAKGHLWNRGAEEAPLEPHFFTFISTSPFHCNQLPPHTMPYHNHTLFRERARELRLLRQLRDRGLRRRWRTTPAGMGFRTTYPCGMGRQVR